MDPEWVKLERQLKDWRKKGCDFTQFQENPEKLEAFLKIRASLSRDLVLHHVDYVGAAQPDQSGRPLEMFVDASDYAWAACLCQRLEPHGTPKIVALACKGFSDAQLRWSVMERELYALHQGVLGHDRLIRGFKVYCYIDHNNNLFSEAQLDNWRRSNKM